MRTLDRLCGLMPGEIGSRLRGLGDRLCEVRLRANRQTQLRWAGGELLCGEALELDRLRGILSSLMDYSVYARESELSEGFFTMPDGCRVGVCGRFSPRPDGGMSLTAIGSACIRISREIKGCADEAMRHVMADGNRLPRSTLIVSEPGMGKTTLLRDMARQLSDGGLCVGLSDERHEIAACVDGAPTMDVGARTDVVDGSPRHIAISRLLHACAPQVIVADEIGDSRDAAALADAVRCGASVITTAHARSAEAAMKRPCLREIVETGVFSMMIVLGGRPGEIVEYREL